MVSLNLKDGKTVKFNLSEEADRESFNAYGRDAGKVTGIWITNNKKSCTLPIPTRFRRVLFYCELIKTGEAIVVQADGVRLVITNYYGDGSPNVRVNLIKTGKQMFMP
jgi:hypothetical protein